VNEYLQIWLVEGRDFRSPNTITDCPDKSIWGKEQKEWLKKTLLESDAIFKLLISPTPIYAATAISNTMPFTRQVLKNSAAEPWWMRIHVMVENPGIRIQQIRKD